MTLVGWSLLAYLVGVICFGVGAYNTFRGHCDFRVLIAETFVVLLWPITAPVVLVLVLMKKKS